ncbi:MAG TPA: helix-turn-helix transcriptional regulator [Bacillus bacterium]|nr:helix-turn-helix transcriptional regulator [Bacillus sp. (in: firmicutes)]
MVDKHLFKKAIGKQIRLIRLEHNKTLEQLGESSNLDPNNLGKIERGEKIPSTQTLFKLYSSMNISIDRLFKAVKRELEMNNQEDSSR